MTGTDLCVNKPHCAAAVRPWESEATTSTLPPAQLEPVQFCLGVARVMSNYGYKKKNQSRSYLNHLVASWIYWLCYGSYQCIPCTFNSYISSNFVYLSPSSGNKYILSYWPQYKPTVSTVHLKPFDFFLFPLSLRHSLMPVDCTCYSTEFGINNGSVSTSAASWYCKQQSVILFLVFLVY